MNENLRVLAYLVVTLIAASFLAAFFASPHGAPPAAPGSISGGKPLAGTLGGIGNFSNSLRKFNSISELEQWLTDYGATSSSGAYNYGGGIMARGIVSSIAPSPTGAASDKAEGFAPSTLPQAGIDYSSTNVQVAGVDEADYVKSDGRYIYLIAANKLLIVNGTDPAKAGIISTTSLFDSSGTDSSSYYYYNRAAARELFVSGDKLVLIAQVPKQSVVFQKYDITPIPEYRQTTGLFIFDISDRTAPKLTSNFTVSGDYYQARMIGDNVYFITQEPVQQPPILHPPVIYSATQTLHPEIYYFDSPQANYQFSTVASLKLSDERIVDAKTFMLGGSDTLMVSSDNIYISYQKQNNYYWPCLRCRAAMDEYSKERFFGVVVPLLPAVLQANITAITTKGLGEEAQWREISQTLSNYFQPALEQNSHLSDAEKEEYSALMESIQSALAEYDTRKAVEDSKTVIHKLGIKDGLISYGGKGEVEGRLLNQFSMDEYNNHLRVATTTDVWVRKHVQYNNVYVLGRDMLQVGALENLAPDEKIYSTRFMGERLYMVTFKQMDPLFVIDLSSPTHPKVLGTLKIPGYSDYLHPVNATHLIGVGKETETSDWGGVRPAGVKVALFDVSDPADPKEIDNVVIGDAGSDSEVLRDHKAFLYSPKDSLLVLPISVVESTGGRYYDTRRVWDGAVAYKVGPGGFTLLGKVKHSSSSSQYYYWDYGARVHRSLYIGDALYTFSNAYIKVNELVDGLPGIVSIDLPEAAPDYPRYIE